jgi:hypothetical protein
MLRVRPPALAVGLLLAAALVAPGVPAGAQGVLTTPTPVPGATSSSTGSVTFRCPGVTEVSSGAELPAARATPTAVTSLSPADQAENPCIIRGSEPDLEWSADHNALRLTAPGTWKTKMRVVLTDFDALHRQYVANPRVKDMGMWPARLEETLQLLELLAYQSRQDVVVYYAGALRDEYKAGIFDEHPLLTHYGLQARAMLGDLSSPPPTPTPHPRARR